MLTDGRVSFVVTLAPDFGADLLRFKGVLAIKGLAHRAIFQGVHELMGGSAGSPWGEDEPRRSTLVFIGRDLPREIIEQGLRQSLVPAQAH